MKDGNVKVMNGDLVITDGGKVVVNNWTIKDLPDYIFDPSYVLPDLSVVEKLVKIVIAIDARHRYAIPITSVSEAVISLRIFDMRGRPVGAVKNRTITNG